MFIGKAQTAAVKRDAEIGVAQANRDAGIREAECEKAAMDVKYNTDTKIEDNSRAFKLQKANFDKEVNTAVSRIYVPYARNGRPRFQLIFPKMTCRFSFDDRRHPLKLRG